MKLGVIAPFEGRGRSLGYAVLPEIKAAVSEVNAVGALGPYRVAVVAFNDSLDPATAAEQARALALDPDVFGVVGPFSRETADAALPILASRNLPAYPVTSASIVDDDFSEEVAEAKEAARTLLEALAAEIEASGGPGRPAR